MNELGLNKHVHREWWPEVKGGKESHLQEHRVTLGAAAGTFPGTEAAISGMAKGVILGVAAQDILGTDGTISHPDYGGSLMTVYMYEYSENGQCV